MSLRSYIPYVSEVISERIDKHLKKLESHPTQPTSGDTNTTDEK
jgi:hypothetical protein